MRWIALVLAVCFFSLGLPGCTSPEVVSAAGETAPSNAAFLNALDEDRGTVAELLLANQAFTLQSDVDQTRLVKLRAKHTTTVTPAQVDILTRMDETVAAVGLACAAHMENLRQMHAVGYRARVPVFSPDQRKVRFLRSQAQGNMIRTDRSLDIAIIGEGYFCISAPDTTPSGIVYTRAGNFFINGNGQIALGSADGPLLEPSITIDDNATNIGISPDGIISGHIPGTTDRSDFGQIELARFRNADAMGSEFGNVLTETDASGPSMLGEPDTNSFGKVLGKFLESSNVTPFTELDHIHRYQRWLRMIRATAVAVGESQASW